MSPEIANVDSSVLRRSFFDLLVQAAGSARRFQTEPVGKRTKILSSDFPPFLLEEIPVPSAPAVGAIWAELVDASRVIDAIPIVGIPRVTRAVAEVLARDNANWVDGAGNARVRAPSLLLSVQGRATPVRVGRSPSADPFAAKSSNIVRLLLANPGRSWRQKDLVERTGLSQSQASKVLKALEQMHHIRRNDDGAFRVADAAGLLDGWADAYRYRSAEIVPVHLSGEGMGLARDVDRRLGDRGVDVSHWFTGLPAAWAYTEFARFRLVSVYVDADPESVASELNLRATERGANLHLIGVGQQRLDMGQQRPQDLPCVHPSQVYLDLQGLPERASEAAVQIRPFALGVSR